MKQQQNPLVSVVVLTYNSSRFIIETLDSIKVQTYSNIELVIADDRSEDNTIEVCKNWLYKNSRRFKRTLLVESNQNTGIPANCNRGLKNSNGIWLKFIAGDDILADDAIEANINFVSKDININIVVSKYLSFIEDNGVKNTVRETPNTKRHLKFFTLDANKQYKFLLFRSFNIAPSAFIKKKSILEVGGFDERYKFIEDLPLWLKTTRNGEKIFFLNKITVYYRVDNNSITRRKKNLYNTWFYNSYWDVVDELIIPNIKTWDFLYWNYYYIERLRYKIALRIFHNKRWWLSSFTHKFIGYLRFYELFHSLKRSLFPKCT